MVENYTRELVGGRVMIILSAVVMATIEIPHP